MKRFLFCGALVLSVLMILACKTTTTGQTDSGSVDSVVPQNQAEQDLKEIYEEYKGDLILDGAKKYIVVEKDRLVDIARKEYKDGFYFTLIMLASSKVVLDPDKIKPGMELIIPDLQRNLDNPRSKASLKNFFEDMAKFEIERNRPQDAEGLRKLANSL